MKTGDKVVCVSGDACECCGGETGLVTDQIYVIRDMLMGEQCSINPNDRGVLFIKLVGLFPPKTSRHGYDTGFDSKDFRLLDHLKEQSRNQETAKKAAKV